MDNPPEVPIPYRFADPAPRAGRYAFPHAVRASKPGETGDQTYEVEKGRKMTLACKFNVDGMDAADSMDTTPLPLLSLSVEIEATHGCWREAKSCDLGIYSRQKSIMD